MMLEYSLSLLNRIVGQRKELLKNFEKILIVASGFTYDLSKESRITRTKLMALKDRNILECVRENQFEYNVNIFSEDGIIQDLDYLCQCLKRN